MDAEPVRTEVRLLRLRWANNRIKNGEWLQIEEMPVGQSPEDELS